MGPLLPHWLIMWYLVNAIISLQTFIKYTLFGVTIYQRKRQQLCYLQITKKMTFVLCTTNTVVVHLNKLDYVCFTVCLLVFAMDKHKS